MLTDTQEEILADWRRRAESLALEVLRDDQARLLPHVPRSLVGRVATGVRGMGLVCIPLVPPLGSRDERTLRIST